jgi:hypothetical protein
VLRGYPGFRRGARRPARRAWQHSCSMQRPCMVFFGHFIRTLMAATQSVKLPNAPSGRVPSHKYCNRHQIFIRTHHGSHSIIMQSGTTEGLNLARTEGLHQLSLLLVRNRTMRCNLGQPTMSHLLLDQGPSCSSMGNVEDDGRQRQLKWSSDV